MFQVEDKPTETIHLYVVREGRKRPSLVPLILSLLALAFLIVGGILTPYKQLEERTVIRVPAVLLPLRTFTTSVKVTATGVRTHPATTAHGILTITNGSILSEELPKGMILTGKDGIEIVTDSPVFVPPGSASGYGFATVSAHAAIAGRQGNIAILDINQVEGTALYIRNLASFTGGQNAFTTTFITAADKASAKADAHTKLAAQISKGILLRPCSEAITGNQTIQVTWQCQFATYHSPSYMRVTNVRVEGMSLFLDVVFVAHPKRIETK